MEHSFSVEMNSRKYLQRMSISQNHVDHVLFEGNLGKLEKLTMVEEAVLVFKGSNGILRLDLSQDELKALVSEARSKEDRK